MYYLAKILYKPKGDSYFDYIDVDYLNTLFYLNGQILGEYIVDDTDMGIIGTVMLTSLDSLEPEYWSKEIEEVIKDFDIEIKVLNKKEHCWSYDECDCGGSSFYILDCSAAALLNEGYSPIRCGDCLKQVLLIDLPGLEFDDKEEILRYVEIHRALATVLTSPKDYDQKELASLMLKYDSKIVKHGIEICKNIEEKIGKPVYYYYNQSNNLKVCPKCGKKLENIPVDIIGYSHEGNIDKVCEKCHLAFYTKKE